MMPILCPARIVTPRLVLRRWNVGDARALQSVIEDNVDHLRRFLPWAWREPLTLEERRSQLHHWACRFEAGQDWIWGVFAPAEAELWGSIGLHRPGGEGVFEISYWLAREREGQGLMTEAVRALIEVCAEVLSASTVRICCDGQNQRSASIPQRFGFDLVHAIEEDLEGWQRVSLVWDLDLSEGHRK